MTMFRPTVEQIIQPHHLVSLFPDRIVYTLIPTTIYTIWQQQGSRVVFLLGAESCRADELFLVGKHAETRAHTHMLEVDDVLSYVNAVRNKE